MGHAIGSSSFELGASSVEILPCGSLPLFYQPADLLPYCTPKRPVSVASTYSLNGPYLSDGPTSCPIPLFQVARGWARFLAQTQTRPCLLLSPDSLVLPARYHCIHIPGPPAHTDSTRFCRCAGKPARAVAGQAGSHLLFKLQILHCIRSL